MKWPVIQIDTEDGMVQAAAPYIVSASRRSDIPAFYSEQFIRDLRRGYTSYHNPFNGKKYYISFSNVRVIVFWSKYPAPIMPYLAELDDRSISYYFQFTLNDYEKEHLEPGLPPLRKRIECFKELSRNIGQEKVIWRFDPLILTETLAVEELTHRIGCIGNELSPYTEKLVISFVDIEQYTSVKKNIADTGCACREFTENEVKQCSHTITGYCRQWGLYIAACAEGYDLTEFGIIPNKCIDDELIRRIAINVDELRPYFKKDTGQRKECGCIMSRDIGEYDTCRYECVYCYAR